MKKFLLPFALLAATIHTVSAQDGRDNFHVGLKAGANLSNVYDSRDDRYQFDGKVGFAGGAFVAIPLGKFLGIQPEVLYSQRGYTMSGSGYDYNRTLSYIDVPLQLAIKPIPGLTILAGPQYSYLVHRKDSFTSNGFTGSVEDAVEGDIRENTLCLVGGIDINALGFTIAPRVGFDLMNNYKNGSSTNPRFKNNWVQLTVGFRI